MWSSRALYVTALFAVVVVISSEVQSKDASSDQLDFLTELYSNTSGEMWVNNTNWLVNDNSTSICDWYGITCSGKWVEKLDLSSNGLGGPLPDKWERVPYLSSLDLSSNKILGTLPASIGNLSLSSLLLSGNDLRGTIPSSIGSINSRLLYLDNNQFTGTLPTSLAMKSLQGLTLDLNKLTGTIPSSFGDIGSQLMVVSAAFNSFDGKFPSGLCKANACNFQYNTYLQCPYDGCNCGIALCNCGKSCYSSSDCSGGSCSSCSKNGFGVHTCGGR